jgi:hypothetical protein
MKINEKGQFMIIGALIIAVFMFALVLAISQLNVQRQMFSYEPVDEVVLAISSDFERLLQSALSRASQSYLANRDLVLARSLFDDQIQRWLLVVSEAYSGYGVNITLMSEWGSTYADLVLDWSEDRGVSYAYTTFGMDVEIYGFRGLALTSSVSVRLDILEAKMSFTSGGGRVAVKFRVNESIGGGRGLAPSIKDLKVMAEGGVIDEGSVRLSYLGQGIYLVEFNVSGFVVREIVLVVTTERGIVVVAKKGLCVVELRSDDVSTPAEDNEGNFTINGTVFSIPSNMSVFPGQVLNVSFEVVNKTFLGFSVSGPLNITEQHDFWAMIRVLDKGYGKIVALYTSYLPPAMCYVNVSSQEIHGESSNKGVVEVIEVNGTPNGTKYNLSETGPVVLAFPYNSTVLMCYYPECGYVFKYWFLSGGLTCNDTSSQTITVRILGNGTLTALYEVSRPENWRIVYINPAKGREGFVLALTELEKEYEIHPISYGQDTQSGTSTETTPTLMLGDIVRVILYARATSRDVGLNVTLGYYYNDVFHLIGSNTTTVVRSSDYVVYTITIEPLTKAIPEGSKFVLILERAATDTGGGTLHVLCGPDKSRIELW